MAYLAQRFRKHHGGTGANIAWNLGLLGLKPVLVSTVGNDGGEYLAVLKDKGVNVSYVEEISEHATATAIIATDSREQQITFFHPGADQHGTWPDLSGEEIKYAIISPRDTGLMQKAADWCAQNGVHYLFDPGQQILAFSDDELKRIIKKSAGLIMNDYEWSLIKDKLKVSEDDIRSLTPLVIITHGEKGATVINTSGEQKIKACKADRVLNPTGAGDGFRAGILAGLQKDWPIENCIRLGAGIASFVVEDEGTLMESLDLDELQNRIETTYGETLPLNSK